MDDRHRRTPQEIDRLEREAVAPLAVLERAVETVDHPAYYGGADNPYEAIKVIAALGLDFWTGNAFKYLARAGKKPGVDEIEDLEKSVWYLKDKIERLKKKQLENEPIFCAEEDDQCRAESKQGYFCTRPKYHKALLHRAGSVNQSFDDWSVGS